MGAETPADALDIALLVARAIESAGGRYFVGGSLASSLQGEPRATNDIDVVVDLPLGRCRAFVEALGPDFEADEAQLRTAIADGGREPKGFEIVVDSDRAAVSSGSSNCIVTGTRCCRSRKG